MSVTAVSEITALLQKLDNALSNNDIDAAMELFHEDSYWRDFVSFTWNLITLEGQDEIRDMLKVRLADVRPVNWKLDEEHLAQQDGPVSQGFIRFETQQAHGYGYIRVRDGRIFTILTTMQDLKGHEEQGRIERPFGLVEGIDAIAAPTWGERREQELAEIGVTKQPYVLIVGGGHSGIILGARLRMLGVPALIVETNERPGDNWRKRYRTLQLHNPVYENHLPYLPFPDNWPIYMSKDKFADWLESYTKMMELNYWGSSEVQSATYDEATGTWEVRVNRDGEEVIVRPNHMVMATGSHARLQMPELPGQDIFQGVQQHSSQHKGPEEMQGKKVVVVGAGTSAHDICAALAAHDVDVTMVQRTPTYVVKPRTFNKYTLGPLYSEEALQNGIDHEKGDILSASVPFQLFFDIQKIGIEQIKKVDADFYEQLAATGFMLDFGPRDSGLFGRALTGVNNYYIDVGASQMIIDGKIKVASGSGVECLTENSVILEDGRELSADAVIYATGFQDMYGTMAELISQDVADKVGRVWGIGSGESASDPGPWEGEIRNMWKPVPQEGLWLHGSLIAHARSFSRYLALQLKARHEGIPTPVYRLGNRSAYEQEASTVVAG
jgi:putative flavoprotein involved in K+ transport